MADLAQHLANLDKRVRRLEQIVEQQLGKSRVVPSNTSTQSAATAESVAPAPAVPKGLQTAGAVTRPSSAASGERSPVPVTQILGWSGAAALVLAAVYFIRLAIDSGWLTPERQVGLAALSGVGLIWIGLALRKANRSYASLLPAAGIVILFATVFGAHIYYEFIGALLATGCVVAICIVTLWLGRVFDNYLYVLFAVVGAYLTPFLLPVWHANLIDLLIYYSAWSVLFCGYAIWLGGRQSYLLAMYLALIGFDLIWRAKAESQWMTTAIFQAIQFLIFVCAAAIYSIRRNAPMTDEQAWAHAPGLVIFYAVEYFILGTYLPEWAPWIALASVAVLVLVYWAARSFLDSPSDAGAMLVAAYAALVLFHAVYIDLVPFEWAPWFALGMLTALGVYAVSGGALGRSMIPFAAVIGLMVALSFLQLITGYKISDVPAATLLSLLFAAALYAGYAMISDEDPVGSIRIPLLYAAHVAAMVTVSREVDASLLVSIFWGMIAIGSLLIALVLRDRILGQSSLLIFAISGMKVLLYDLAGSPTPVRIGTLVVLGITLYIGGWLYQKLSVDEVDDESGSLAGAGSG
jgi:uncharacterized membrane protein